METKINNLPDSISVVDKIIDLSYQHSMEENMKNKPNQSLSSDVTDLSFAIYNEGKIEILLNELSLISGKMWYIARYGGNVSKEDAVRYGTILDEIEGCLNYLVKKKENILI